MTTQKKDTEKILVYDIDDFPYGKFDGRTYIEDGKKKYHNALATFDIETTSIIFPDDVDKRNFGFMYVWQFCIDGILVMGRTWKEYKTFLNRLLPRFENNKAKLVCYVHNLSFEFQFMRNFFKIDSIFAKSERNVIKAVIEGVEYRCSYTLTNMGLEKFTNKTKGVIHKKRDGEEFDYSIRRYPDTELTDMEVWYCVCDVLGLYEGLLTLLEEDTLITIPMTSTGYVRRDFKEVCTNDKEHMKMFKKSQLSPLLYGMCKEASRGAIAGSNHIYTEKIIDEPVRSRDIKSSYPYVMATKYFPQSAFSPVWTKYNQNSFEELLNGYCCLIRWECRNIKIKQWSAIPYISKAKCRASKDAKTGNGKVYKASRIGMICTEIDFKIIREQYTFDKDSVIIHEMYIAEKGMLSKSFRKTLIDMFQLKTDLEDGDPFLYNKFKNKINAAFGMMLTDITNPTIRYVADSLKEPYKKEILNIQSALKKYYMSKNSFLTYQHGVWVLAHARNSLFTGMQIVKEDIVQVDTDSVKHLGDYTEQFETLNRWIMEKAETYDIKPYAMKNGQKHFLGVWENDGYYEKFITLGAKKYAYDNGDGVHITVAGLSKEKGANWLNSNGGLSKIKNGTTVPAGHSGRTTSYYNDMLEPITQYIDGHKVTYGSNVAIKNVPYTFGLTKEWAELILDGILPEDEILEEEGAYETLEEYLGF